MTSVSSTKTTVAKTATVKEVVAKGMTGPRVTLTDSQLAVAYLVPVIYNGTDGGGPNEYLAGSGGARNFYTLNAISSGQIIAAFYEPYDNIGAIVNFSFIGVSRLTDTDIQLGIGSGASSGRMRLAVTVLYTP